MTQPLPWRWALSPTELLGNFRFIRSATALALGPAVRPFECARTRLAGTPYEYQIALSDRSIARDVVALREAQPELPLSGDRRSGFLIFDGERVVASLIIPGNLTNQGYKLWTVPERRREGLAFRALVEWCWLTRRPPIEPQGITAHALRAYLAAHREVVERAVAHSLPVPARVREALAEGRETAELLAAADRVEQSTPKERTRWPLNRVA